MNSNTPAPSAATIAHALPKLGVLTFLVLWGMEGGQIPLGRLSLIFGGFALVEALVAAAVERQGVLGWGDLPAFVRGLLGPAGLPFYALVAAGVFLVGEVDHGRRMNVATPAERTGVPPRIVPTPRSLTPGVTLPQAPGTRVGSPGTPAINFAPKGPAAPTSSSRAPVRTTTPTPAANSVIPQPRATPTPAPSSAPSAPPTATAAPAAPASGAPRQQ